MRYRSDVIYNHSISPLFLHTIPSLVAKSKRQPYVINSFSRTEGLSGLRSKYQFKMSILMSIMHTECPGCQVRLHGCQPRFMFGSLEERMFHLRQ